MKDPAMSNEPVDTPEAEAGIRPRNKGQALVESFRLARIAARPALRSDLRVSRTALQQQRLQQLGHAGKPAQIAPPALAACAPATSAPVADTPSAPEAAASVFAGYCTAIEAPPPAIVHEAAPQSASQAVPLSAIGFGPGMKLRLSQLGIETAADLAAADGAWLQAALGDLSDLVHAERWIALAREACAAQPAF